MWILASIMIIFAIFTFVLIIGDASDSDNDMGQEKKKENLEKYT